MFSKDLSEFDVTLLTLASVALTVPFIFYAKDISRSLRIIAARGPAENRINAPC